MIHERQRRVLYYFVVRIPKVLTFFKSLFFRVGFRVRVRVRVRVRFSFRFRFRFRFGSNTISQSLSDKVLLAHVNPHTPCVQRSVSFVQDGGFIQGLRTFGWCD